MDSDPHALAHRHILDAAAWLHSIAVNPCADDVIGHDAARAATELLDVIAAYPHLWPAPPDGGPTIADPE
jgi:hypothetical protein